MHDVANQWMEEFQRHLFPNICRWSPCMMLCGLRLDLQPVFGGLRLASLLQTAHYNSSRLSPSPYYCHSTGGAVRKLPGGMLHWAGEDSAVSGEGPAGCHRCLLGTGQGVGAAGELERPADLVAHANKRDFCPTITSLSSTETWQ